MTHNEVQQLSGGDLLVDALLEQGITRIFGLPGIQLDPFFDAIARRGAPEVIGVRHEQAVSYLADGFSRTNDKPGVGVVVPGPGMLNALAGLSTAYACESRLLLLVGQISSDQVGKGVGALHEIPDQSGILRSLTRWHGVATSAAEVPALVQEALEALDRFGGPAALEVPVDVLAGLTNERITAKPSVAPAHTDAAALQQARDMIQAAQRPMIVAGGGCVRGVDQAALTAFAELLGAPVVASENGKGAIDARHTLAFERSGYAELLKEADLVIALGTRFANAMARTLPLNGAKLIAVNSDPLAVHRLAESGLAIEMTAAAFLAEIDIDVERLARPDRMPHLASVRDHVAAKVEQIAPQMAYVDEIRRLMPEGSRLVGEYTQLGYAASYAFGCRFPGEFIWPGYQGTLGYGFATALGVALGQEAPVICVSGDGGFSWTMEELSTLARYQPDLITVVINDGHYGNVRRIQKAQYEGREIASSLTNPDYVKLAEAFGIPAVRVNNAAEFSRALEQCLSEGGPALIELIEGEFPSSWQLGYPN